MYRLINYANIPSGTFWFQETAPSGAKKTCGPVPDIMDCARCLGAFRSANGLPRADITDCLADVNSFTCARMGNPSSTCVECTLDEFLQVNQSIPGIQKCAGCGAVVET